MKDGVNFKNQDIPAPTIRPTDVSFPEDGAGDIFRGIVECAMCVCCGVEGIKL